MKKIELLAPVGSQETLEAAIHAGADAVYLAGNQFGARKSAKNFDEEGIISAIQYCHLHGVSVYVTVNTLIKPDEVEAMHQWIDFLYQKDADAIIIQDLAVLRYIQAHYPDFPCHASTQMTCHHLGDVIMAQEMGFKRVVLARELSLEEIIDIYEQTHVELEFFVHGALCISYSGQCLMSSSIGGRSGNRGACAQPCRQAYLLKRREDNQVMSDVETPYLLSPKDVNAMAMISSLKGYERISLKIEGRMKRVDYVYSVVNAYRQELEGHPVQISGIERAFNRGYSQGHLGKADFSQLMNYQSPSHQGTLLGKVIGYSNQTVEIRLFDDIHKSDEIQIRRSKDSLGTRADMIFKGGQRVNEAYRGDVVKVPFKHHLKKNEMVYKTFDTVFVNEMNQLSQTVYPLYGLKAHLTMKIGEKAVLELRDSQENQCQIVSQVCVESARHKPLTEERIIEQLSKLGGTLFYLSETSIELEEKAVIGISELNKMRRDGVAFFEKEYSLWHRERQMTPVNRSLQSREGVGLALNAQQAPAYDYIIEGIDEIKSFPVQGNDRYILSDLTLYQENMSWCIDHHIIPMMPKIIRQSEWTEWDKWIERYYDAGGRKVMIRQLGTLKHLKAGMTIILDTSFNILNGESMMAYAEVAQNYILDTLYFSNEMSLSDLTNLKGLLETSDQLMKLKTPIQCGVAMFGHLELMTSEYCAVGGAIHGHDHCGECSRHAFYLEDMKKRQFPLSLDPKNCRMTVLSEMPISEFKQLNKCLENGIGRFKIDLRNVANEKWREDLHHKRFSNIRTQQRSYLLEAIE